MENCFKILQLKFDQKLTNRCIELTLHISASTVFEVRLIQGRRKCGDHLQSAGHLQAERSGAGGNRPDGSDEAYIKYGPYERHGAVISLRLKIVTNRQ